MTAIDPDQRSSAYQLAACPDLQSCSQNAATAKTTPLRNGLYVSHDETRMPRTRHEKPPTVRSQMTTAQLITASAISAASTFIVGNVQAVSQRRRLRGRS